MINVDMSGSIFSSRVFFVAAFLTVVISGIFVFSIFPGDHTKYARFDWLIFSILSSSTLSSFHLTVSRKGKKHWLRNDSFLFFSGIVVREALLSFVIFEILTALYFFAEPADESKFIASLVVFSPMICVIAFLSGKRVIAISEG
ncbi:MAG: hypothetical protein IPJ67_04140 [Candidatus Moraniibacteriota bacterium]|nr:MAG: hypothetical protein IPJ67_04140 [Candidatus Moranbacteria bacterium]